TLWAAFSGGLVSAFSGACSGGASGAFTAPSRGVSGAMMLVMALILRSGSAVIVIISANRGPSLPRPGHLCEEHVGIRDKRARNVWCDSGRAVITYTFAAWRRLGSACGGGHLRDNSVFEQQVRYDETQSSGHGGRADRAGVGHGMDASRGAA